MASILKMDIKDLFSKKKDSNNKDKDSNTQKILLKRMSVIFLLMILIFISYWFFLKPHSEEQSKKLDELNQWKDQIIYCNQENELLNNERNELIQYNEEKGKLFVSSEEFENFYAKLYEATGNLNLRIVDVTRKEEAAVYASDPNLVQNVDFNSTTPCTENFDTSILMANIDQNESIANNQDNCEQDNQGNCKQIAYYKMLVDFEIRGTFPNYIKFRNIIASEEKIVNIENEEILRDNEVQNSIIATATVSLIKTPQ